MQASFSIKFRYSRLMLPFLCLEEMTKPALQDVWGGLEFRTKYLSGIIMVADLETRLVA